MSKIVVGITGPNGAGKTLFAKKLAEISGGIHFSVRELLTAILIERGVESNRETQTQLANELREINGSDVIVRMQIEKAVAQVTELVVIESFRSMAEVEYAYRTLGQHNIPFILVACDAPLLERIVRMQRRGGENDHKLGWAFIQDENRELYGSINTQSLAECMKAASITVRIPQDSTGISTEATAEYVHSVIRSSWALPLRTYTVPPWNWVCFQSGPLKAEPYALYMPLHKITALGGDSYEKAFMPESWTAFKVAQFLNRCNVCPTAPFAIQSFRSVMGKSTFQDVVSLEIPGFHQLGTDFAGFRYRFNGEIAPLRRFDTLESDDIIVYRAPWTTR